MKVRLKFVPDHWFIGVRWYWFPVDELDLRKEPADWQCVQHWHLWLHLLPCVAAFFHWRVRR